MTDYEFLIDKLDEYPRWTLSKYAQPFGNEGFIETLYECSILFDTTSVMDFAHSNNRRLQNEIWICKYYNRCN